MSTAPEPVSASPTADSKVSKFNQMFKNCWSCRVLSGSGLVASGAYVYLAARKVMRQGGITSIGTVTQIAFAASLAAWGLVILVDPVGKAQRKT